MKSARICLLIALSLSASCAGIEYRRHAQGVLWLNQFDLVVSDSDRIALSTNGTDVFVEPKPGLTFPDAELIPIYVPAIPPGLRITGVRVCYAIIGNDPDTKVHRLRLSRFEDRSGGGTNWPGYVIAMDDPSVASAVPVPPPAGFAYDDPSGFVCVDSSQNVCLDPGKGTIAADVGVQLGDDNDRVVIRALGLRYDSTCLPY